MPILALTLSLLLAPVAPESAALALAPPTLSLNAGGGDGAPSTPNRLGFYVGTIGATVASFGLAALVFNPFDPSPVSALGLLLGVVPLLSNYAIAKWCRIPVTLGSSAVAYVAMLASAFVFTFVHAEEPIFGALGFAAALLLLPAITELDPLRLTTTPGSGGDPPPAWRAPCREVPSGGGRAVMVPLARIAF